jgi:hypothetical protein
MTVTPWIALSPLAAVILARNVSQDPFEDPRARCGTSRPLTGPVGADTLTFDRVDALDLADNALAAGFVRGLRDASTNLRIKIRFANAFL